MTIPARHVSVVIPTYGRERVLLETIRQLLGLPSPAAEILVVDQTAGHQAETDAQLSEWNRAGDIRWVRRGQPSIAQAMNEGLRRASGDLVLFLDDDIQPLSDLAGAHAQAHLADPEVWATVGQVIQPWQQPEDLEPPRKGAGLWRDLDFPFHSTRDAEVQNVMAGNLCVNRSRALSVGGFDENFTGVAYRFETDFARRIGQGGGRIRFLGSAGIRHLRLCDGGTRTEGSHLTSASPRHGAGDYYFAFSHGGRAEAWRYAASRCIREVTTRFHLRRPWWVPVKILGEVRALRMAIKLCQKGPSLLNKP